MILAGVVCFGAQSPAQSVLFDFENASAGSSLPLNLTVGGITASFSSSGLGGFYIQQPQNTILYTPVGFSGNALIPSSIYGADLHIGFSQVLTNFSILYAPQELACDSSARMRVTVYMNGTFVGTATTNAVAGTWPSETLSYSSMQGFNSAVVHYDAPPPTGGDYGVIFLADNMTVTPAPQPPALKLSLLTGQIQIVWPTNATGFSLQANTNLMNVGTWVAVTNAPVLADTNNMVTLPVETADHFFRLSQ